MFYRNSVRKIHSIWDIPLQKCRDLENRVRGPSRSLEMSPFDRVHVTSYWRSIVTIWLYLVSFLRYSMSKNVVTLKSGSEVTQGHWKWHHSVERVWFLISCSLVTLSLKCTVLGLETRVSGHWRSSKMIPFNPAPMTYFLLTFPSNHWPISHRFWDKRRFPSKIANFSHPHVFNAPAEGVPLGIGYRCRGQKNDGATMVEKVLR